MTEPIKNLKKRLDEEPDLEAEVKKLSEQLCPSCGGVIEIHHYSDCRHSRKQNV